MGFFRIRPPGSPPDRGRQDEELKASWEQFTGSPRVQSVVEKGREVVDTGKERGLQAVDRATESVKDRLEGGQAGSS